MVRAAGDSGFIAWADAVDADGVADAAALAAHLADTVDAHDASAVSFSPAQGLAATTVQAAIEEVVTDAAATYSTLRHLRETGAARSQAVRMDVTKLRADNASAPLTFTTPDATGQLTHISVVVSPEEWNGYRYWGVATPYAAANNQVENPCVYASDDGTTWVVPAGLTNPIEATPAGGSYNSDPDLEFSADGSTLYCVWRQYLATSPGTEERIYYRSSTDGVTWGSKTLLLSNDPATSRPVSPSLIWDGTNYRMYTVDIIPSPNTLAVRVATTVDGLTAATPQTVTLTGISGLGSTREAWHIEVNKWGDQYHMLVNDTDINQAGSTGMLYMASSSDGLTFTSGTEPLIPRRRWAVAGTNVFDSYFYRSTMVPCAFGSVLGYEIWYSGIVGTNYQIGHTFARFDEHDRLTGPTSKAGHKVTHGIADPDTVNLLAARVPLYPFTCGDAFTRADGALGTADSGEAWTTWAGVPGVLSKKAYATTATNAKAVLTGTADGYTELCVSTFGSSAWLIFRGTDTNNYLRFGWSNGLSLVVQKIVAGAASALTSIANYTNHPGARATLAVRRSGSTITLYLDGQLLDSFTDTTFQTAVLVGWQTADVTTRFASIYDRQLVNGE